MNPLIAIVTQTEINRFGLLSNAVATTYSDAIENAGGIPVILPFARNRQTVAMAASRIDGFLFPGGADVDPVLYGEAPISALGPVNRELDEFQIAVLETAMAHRKPVLGICRGIQLINVALGGSLYQDIAAQQGSKQDHMQQRLSFDVDHPVEIVSGTRLHGLFGSRLMVNSRHHQSVKTLGKGLIITAKSPDGIVEAAEHQTLPLDLIQWHPELLLKKNDDMLCLFQQLIQNARRSHGD
jgi:putative glutamine amidotransferase